MEREESTAWGEKAQKDHCVPTVNQMGLKFAYLRIFVCKNPKLRRAGGETHSLKYIFYVNFINVKCTC